MTKKYTTKELAEWLESKARTPIGYRQALIRDADRSRDAAVIGRMFFFSYDPKWKDILPIYDRYPLVFPIEKYSDGFLGLNLHYLDVNQRIRLLTSLSATAANKKVSPTTRLRISYDLLQQSKSLATAARPCIKRYLFNHVRSKFIEITADEWDKAAQLPIELFVRNN
mgnify:CR=1 FL=1